MVTVKPTLLNNHFCNKQIANQIYAVNRVLSYEPFLRDTNTSPLEGGHFSNFFFIILTIVKLHIKFGYVTIKKTE